MQFAIQCLQSPPTDGLASDQTSVDRHDKKYRYLCQARPINDTQFCLVTTVST